MRSVEWSWKLELEVCRAFNDWELDMIVLNAIQKEKVNVEPHKMSWKGGKGDLFSVKEAY